MLSVLTISGKVKLGLNESVTALRAGKAKMVILANNTPKLTKSSIEYYALVSGVGVFHYNGTNVDLGTACGKYFRVGTLVVTDVGDSDIVRSTMGADK
jgi:large subunit ribosomal protein L30e